MSCITADRLPTRPHSLRSLALALLVALVGVTCSGTIAPSARAADEALLPPPGSCGTLEQTPPTNSSRSYWSTPAQCLINAVRVKKGLSPIAPDEYMSQAASLKGRDIVRCGVFSHNPCGLGDYSYFPATYLLPGHLASETIAWGTNMTARGAVLAWLGSPTHHDILLNPGFTNFAVWATIGYQGNAANKVWVGTFGG
jgi:uncharacterized protein YkwD